MPRSPGRTESLSENRDNQGTVTIGVYPWVGYDADVAVVSRILETRLGYKVITKPITANDSWPAMESGAIDLVLENWGHEEMRSTYVEERKTVVSAGLVGNKGVIGWYVPIWMAQQYPDIRYWANLNKYSELFRTAETGDKGRVLDGDESYMTNDPALIANHNLDYVVTYSGSEENTIKLVLEASKNHTPLLFYFWQPHWLFRQVKLAKINFPQYTPGCDADPATVVCDYPSYDLDKYVSKRFADRGGDAYAFIKKFSWSNEDQNEVAGYLVNEGLSPQDAADRWMDAHPDTWEPWLPS